MRFIKEGKKKEIKNLYFLQVSSKKGQDIATKYILEKYIICTIKKGGHTYVQSKRILLS